MRDFSFGGVITGALANFTRRFGLDFSYALLPSIIAAGVAELSTTRTLQLMQEGIAPLIALFSPPMHWISVLVSYAIFTSPPADIVSVRRSSTRCS